MGKDQKQAYRKEIGRRLKEARKRAGISSQQAASEQASTILGEELQQSRLGNYEQGIRLPDPLVVRALCQVYGVSPSFIYGFEEAPHNPEEVALIQKYRMTDERGRRAIQGVAEHQPPFNGGPVDIEHQHSKAG